MPKVSIILAAFNPGPFLEATVRSIVAQTFTDWELILVDDGSAEDLSWVSSVDPRITYVRQQNRGLSVARNVGFLRSGGEYIAFSDQDDIWMPEKLGIQVELLDASPEVGLCYTNFDRIDASGQRIGDGFEGGAQTYEELLRGCCVCVSTTVVRRDAFACAGLFDPLYLGSQDYDLWLKLARLTEVRYVPRVVAQYRQHPASLSRRYAELFTEVRHIMEWHTTLARRGGDHAAVTTARRSLRRAYRVYGSQAFDHARDSLRRRDFPQFLTHLARAVRMAPGFVVESLGRAVIERVRPRRRDPASASTSAPARDVVHGGAAS